MVVNSCVLDRSCAHWQAGVTAHHHPAWLSARQPVLARAISCCKLRHLFAIWLGAAPELYREQDD